MLMGSLRGALSLWEEAKPMGFPLLLGEGGGRDEDERLSSRGGDPGVP
jgi:hypothetical protein